MQSGVLRHFFQLYKKIGKMVPIETYKKSMILGLLLSFDAKSILLSNGYFPISGPVDDHCFSHCLRRITSIFAEYDEDNVCGIGDFDALDLRYKCILQNVNVS